MAKLSFGYRRIRRLLHRLRHRLQIHMRMRHRRSYTENVYWSYHACSWMTSVNPKFLICPTKFSDRMVVVRMVVVVVEQECMVELGQGRSSCSDVNRLVVVVGLVGMGLLGLVEVGVVEEVEEGVEVVGVVDMERLDLLV